MSPSGALKGTESSKSTQRNNSTKNRYVGLHKLTTTQRMMSQHQPYQQSEHQEITNTGTRGSISKKEKGISSERGQIFNRRESVSQERKIEMKTLQPPALERDDSCSYFKQNTLQHPSTQPQISEKPKIKEISWQDIKLPIGPEEVLEKFGKMHITDFEKKEIGQYLNIYYIGHKITKPYRSDSHQPNQYNFGFDDDKGDYQYTMNDHIAYRYELVAPLGKGSFGQVVKVFDHKRKEFSAIKIIRNKKNFYNQAIVELNLLKYIKDNDPSNQTNIVKIKDFVIFRSHVCIVFELLSINLYEFLKNNKFNGISLELIRRFSIQILQGMLFLSKTQIIHCDLKPENILLKQENKSGIKIVDFGSSCFENQRVYTYIQSRFYRAPEIILGLAYGIPIDMWSFGCIMAELYMGYPLFPGENEAEQFQMFMEILGVPDEDFLDNCPRKKNFFEDNNTPKITKNSRGKIRTPGSRDLNYFLRCPDKNFLDFVMKCFTWKPKERIIPAQALVHDWILEGLPDEIRVQHLQSMQASSPEVDMRSKFRKYNIDWTPPPNLQLHNTKLASFETNQIVKPAKGLSESENQVNLMPKQISNLKEKQVEGEQNNENLCKKSEYGQNITSTLNGGTTTSTTTTTTGLVERNKNILLPTIANEIGKNALISSQNFNLYSSDNPSSRNPQNNSKILAPKSTNSTNLNNHTHNNNNYSLNIKSDQDSSSNTHQNNVNQSHSFLNPTSRDISIKNKRPDITLSNFSPSEQIIYPATATDAQKNSGQFEHVRSNSPQYQKGKSNTFILSNQGSNFPSNIQVKTTSADQKRRNKSEINQDNQ